MHREKDGDLELKSRKRGHTRIGITDSGEFYLQKSNEIPRARPVLE